MTDGSMMAGGPVAAGRFLLQVDGRASQVVLATAMALFAVQIAFSRWWLAHDRFGPMAWVWRSVTYGVRQPMRRDRPILEGLPE